MLALIEPFDLGKAPMEVEPVHRIVEAERLAFADRNRHLADPISSALPSLAFLDRSYIDHRRALIDPSRARRPAPARHQTRDKAPGGRDATFRE